MLITFGAIIVLPFVPIFQVWLPEDEAKFKLLLETESAKNFPSNLLREHLTLITFPLKALHEH
jgi:hypothetical protein